MYVCVANVWFLCMRGQVCLLKPRVGHRPHWCPTCPAVTTSHIANKQPPQGVFRKVSTRVEALRLQLVAQLLRRLADGQGASTPPATRCAPPPPALLHQSCEAAMRCMISYRLCMIINRFFIILNWYLRDNEPIFS